MRVEIDLAKLRIPAGWAIEPAADDPRQAYLSTPGPIPYMLTIDFARRGFRPGMSTSGSLHGIDLARGTRRRTYGGRGWMQAMVDDAVDHLSALL